MTSHRVKGPFIFIRGGEKLPARIAPHRRLVQIKTKFKKKIQINFLARVASHLVQT